MVVVSSCFEMLWLTPFKRAKPYILVVLFLLSIL